MTRLRATIALCCLAAWLLTASTADAAGRQAKLLLSPALPHPSGSGSVQAVSSDSVRITLTGGAKGQRLDAYACTRKEVTDFKFVGCHRVGRTSTTAAGTLDATLALPKGHPAIVWVVLNKPGVRSLYAAQVDTRVRSAQ
jgi:hypothetical protein